MSGERIFRDELARRVMLALISRDGLDGIKEGDFARIAQFQMERCYAVADGIIACMRDQAKEKQ